MHLSTLPQAAPVKAPIPVRVWLGSGSNEPNSSVCGGRHDPGSPPARYWHVSGCGRSKMKKNNSQDTRNHGYFCCLCVQCPSWSWSPVTRPFFKRNEVITVLSNVSHNRIFKSYVTLYVHLAWRHSMSVTDKEHKLTNKRNLQLCLVTHPAIYAFAIHHPTGRPGQYPSILQRSRVQFLVLRPETLWVRFLVERQCWVEP
jgi:hypothetical protein